MAKAKAAWMNLLLLLITIICCVVLFEIGVRTFLPQMNMNTYDSDIGIVYKNNWEGIYLTEEFTTKIGTNGYGFRDISFTSTRNRTVVFFGDSFTAALEVPLEKTFHKKMHGSIEGADFFALGHGGYDTAKMYLLYNTYVEMLDPDIVVLMFFPHNDVLDTYYNRLDPYVVLDDNTLYVEKKHVPAHIQAKRSIEQHSQAFYFIEFTVFSLVQQQDYDGLLQAYELYLEDEEPYMDDAWKKTAAIFYDLNRKALKQNRSLHIVRIPLKEELSPEMQKQLEQALGRPNVDLHASQRRFNQLCTGLDLSCLDLAEVFQNDTSLYFEENAHWNEKGHKTVALALYNFLW